MDAAGEQNSWLLCPGLEGCVLYLPQYNDWSVVARPGSHIKLACCGEIQGVSLPGPSEVIFLELITHNPLD